MHECGFFGRLSFGSCASKIKESHMRAFPKLRVLTFKGGRGGDKGLS